MRVAVVGAGVLGASTAFHLALAGADVVLVDGAHEGRATAAGAGIICPWASAVADPYWRRIADAGARYFSTLLGLLGEHGETEIGYRKVGALCVSADRAELDQVERLLRTRCAETPEAGDISHLSPADARRLFPPLHPDLAAVRIGGGARVDGRALAAALQRAAVRLGAHLQAGSAELLTEAGHIAGLRAGAEPIAADAVVVAAGAWAPALLAPLGITLAIVPQRGQISHLHLAGADTQSWPVVLPPGSHYLLAFDHGRLVAGATRESGVGFDYRVTAAGQAEVLEHALGVAPGLGPASLLETRVGFRPMGPDVRPMLGAAAGLGGLVIGNGLGPSGLTIGPYGGRLLAQAVLGESPDLDLAPYDPLRPWTGAAMGGAEADAIR